MASKDVDDNYIKERETQEHLIGGFRLTKQKIRD